MNSRETGSNLPITEWSNEQNSNHISNKKYDLYYPRKIGKWATYQIPAFRNSILRNNKKKGDI